MSDFAWALVRLNEGFPIARQNWNGKGQFLKLQVPDENSKMSLPDIYSKTVDGKRVPWVASQSDILSDDWLSLPISLE